MAEPTDEQVAAFRRAWEDQDAAQHALPSMPTRPGDRTRAGLRAVFALPQPLPTQEEALLALANTTLWTVDTWRAIVTLSSMGWQPPEVEGAFVLAGISTPPKSSPGSTTQHAFQPGPARPLGKVRLCTVCGRPPVAHLTPEPPHQWQNPTYEED
jgi:hypothetical protein